MTNEINNEVMNYLKSTEVYGLLLKGPWGSGKTYFWKNEIEPSLSSTYSYTSLFGIKNTDALKHQILTGAIIRSTTDSRSYFNILNKTIKTGLNVATQFTIKQFDRFMVSNGLDPKLIKFLDFKIDPISLIAKSTIVCLDDLERTDIPYRELLGVLDYLINEKDSKIVLIADETKIKDKDYADFKEKILQRTLDISAPVTQIAKKFITENTKKLKLPENTSLSEAVQKVFQHSNLKNIRIIQNSICKIERLLLEDEISLSDYHVAFLTALAIEHDLNGQLKSDCTMYEYQHLVAASVKKDEKDWNEHEKHSSYFYKKYGLISSGYHEIFYSYIYSGYPNLTELKRDFPKTASAQSEAVQLYEEYRTYEWYFSDISYCINFTKRLSDYLEGKKTTTAELLIYLFAAYLEIVRVCSLPEVDFSVSLRSQLQELAKFSELRNHIDFRLSLSEEITGRLRELYGFYISQVREEKYKKERNKLLEALNSNEDSFSILEVPGNDYAKKLISDLEVLEYVDSLVLVAPKTFFRFYQSLISQITSLADYKNEMLTVVENRINALTLENFDSLAKARSQQLLEEINKKMLQATGR